MPGPPLRSARSPLRDRSVFYLPRKETSSYTTYINVCAKPVVVQGIADFQSMLTHAIPGEHVVRVLVDGVVVHQVCRGSLVRSFVVPLFSVDQSLFSLSFSFVWFFGSIRLCRDRA